MAAPRLCSTDGDAKVLCASLADDVFNFSPTIIPLFSLAPSFVISRDNALEQKILSVVNFVNEGSFAIRESSKKPSDCEERMLEYRAKVDGFT